jgi:outer membrane lipoprotein carrier protein
MIDAISDTYGIVLRRHTPFRGNVPVSHPAKRLFSARRGSSLFPVLAGMSVLSILLLIASMAVSQPLTIEQLTAKTQEVYEKTQDLKAGFIQEVTIKSMMKTEREEGMVYFKNPRMMLWDYAKPKSKKLVINAQKAWLYVPEDRMVYVQNADDVYRSRMAVKFLSGIGKLSEDFQIRFSKDTPYDNEGNYHLTLIPKEPGSGVDRLHITVDGKIFQILQCRFNDSFGNTTRLRFSDFSLNTGIPDKFFTFKTPEGVEVVQMPQ